MSKQLLLFFFLLSFADAHSQSGGNLYDGSKTPYCSSCIQLISSRSREIQFGVRITSSGEVYFSISNRLWFEQLLQSQTDGIAIDLVPKDIYDCSKPGPLRSGLSKGFVLPTVYLPELKKRIKDIGAGHIAMLIGNVPASLQQKELEGNLAIIKNGMVCHYTSFTDIERSLWSFLPMGLYTDTLVNKAALIDSNTQMPVYYTKKLQFVIPFPKNKAVYSAADVRPLYDSLSLTKFRIKRVDIRAYSSVEGPEDINVSLQERRARSMVKALQQFQVSPIATHISTSENWLDFQNDVRRSPYPELGQMSKQDVKLKLLDDAVSEEMEPFLKNHRKAIVTIYLDGKSSMTAVNESDLLIRFREAIATKQLYKASLIQTEIFERINDNRLPMDYLDKLEIPAEKYFMGLLNSQEAYRYQLGLTSEAEAVENFRFLLKMDPENPKLLYNICALTFPIWLYDSSYVKPEIFWQELNSLAGKGIEQSLVTRMQVNYHIRMCELHMANYRYKEKDESLRYIMNNYAKLRPSDEDLYALAKYVAYYARFDWAMEMIGDRANAIDANEDLLFYYIALAILSHIDFESASFKIVTTNAIAVNRSRYCAIFNSINNGGSSFQLLDYKPLRKIFCDNCQ